MRLRQRLQLRDRVDVDRRGGEQALDQEEQPRHRNEVVGVVGQVAEQQRIKRHGRVVDDADRVAVARRLRAGLAAEDAGGAADVLDHQRLAEPRLQFGRGGAHDDVGDAAGRDRHDHADRLRRILLRLRGGGAQRQKQDPASMRTISRIAFPPKYDFLICHSITSSARSRTASEIVTPIALAVLRLMTSSNRCGVCTGKSAGLVPCRIFCTKKAP